MRLAVFRGADPQLLEALYPFRPLVAKTITRAATATGKSVDSAFLRTEDMVLVGERERLLEVVDLAFIGE